MQAQSSEKPVTLQRFYQNGQLVTAGDWPCLHCKCYNDATAESCKKCEKARWCDGALSAVHEGLRKMSGTQKGQLNDADVQPVLDQILSAKPNRYQRKAFQKLLYQCTSRSRSKGHDVSAPNLVILKVLGIYSALWTPTLKEYTQVITALGKNKSGWEKTLNVLKAMREKGLEPIDVTYNAAISAHCKAGKVAQAQSLVVEMQEYGIMPNQRTYMALINGCNKGGEPEQAVLIWEQMKEAQVQPDKLLYTTLIASYSAAGELERAQQLIPEMKAAGIQPDAWAYNELIRACNEASAQMLDAFELLAQMKAEGTKPDSISYTSLIHMCAKTGDANLGFLLLQDMLKSGVEPDVFTYSALMTACCRLNDLPRAFAVFDLMGNQGIEPNLVSYNILINACSSQGDSEKAVAVLQTLNQPRSGSQQADWVSFQIAMGACIKSGSVKDGKVVAKLAASAGFRFSEHTAGAWKLLAEGN